MVDDGRTNLAARFTQRVLVQNLKRFRIQFGGYSKFYLAFSTNFYWLGDRWGKVLKIIADT